MPIYEIYGYQGFEGCCSRKASAIFIYRENEDEMLTEIHDWSLQIPEDLNEINKYFNGEDSEIEFKRYGYGNRDLNKDTYNCKITIDIEYHELNKFLDSFLNFCRHKSATENNCLYSDEINNIHITMLNIDKYLDDYLYDFNNGCNSGLDLEDYVHNNGNKDLIDKTISNIRQKIQYFNDRILYIYEKLKYKPSDDPDSDSYDESSEYTEEKFNIKEKEFNECNLKYNELIEKMNKDISDIIDARREFIVDFKSKMNLENRR